MHYQLGTHIRFSGFSSYSIFQQNNLVYFATNIGIVVFDTEEKFWDMAIPASDYKGLDVMIFYY